MTPEAIGGSPVRQAIAYASRATGMDFQFLLSTAVRESSLNPKAEAKTSSATGLFQFLDATWLTTVRRHGAKHGLGAEASLINIAQNGRPIVNDPSLKQSILDLRYDPKISALMAAEFAGDNADYLRGRTGQEPEAGDLYAAHFLGAGGAAELVNAVRERPWASAAELFPSAAAANRPIFYKPNGKERTVSEVLENLRATANRQAPAVNRQEWAAGFGATYGARQSGRGELDQELVSRLMASLLNNDLFSNQPNEFLRLLKPADNQAEGAGNTLNPGMLAQLYAASDKAAEEAGLKSVQSIMGLRSIAQILSPNASSDSDANPSPFGIGMDTQA